MVARGCISFRRPSVGPDLPPPNPRGGRGHSNSHRIKAAQWRPAAPARSSRRPAKPTGASGPPRATVFSYVWNRTQSSALSRGARLSAVEREEAASRTSAAWPPATAKAAGVQTSLTTFASKGAAVQVARPAPATAKWKIRNFVPIESGGGCLVPKDAELLALVSRWRARAEELLLQAETTNDADARLRIREIVARYQRMAERAE